jgi:hypothetical protein
MKRDGYEFILTGAQDLEHPDPTEGVFTTSLVVAHIFRGAVGEFDSNHKSDSVSFFKNSK